MTPAQSNPLLRRPQAEPVEEKPYARFGLTHNPFPDPPTIAPGSDDPRRNGEIYCAELRVSEQADFERLLIPHTERSEEPRPMAVLMDLATRRGRGIGKTAFLIHQQRRIMSDLGDQLTGGAYVLLSAHIMPEGGGRTRKFWQFARLITRSLNDWHCIAWAVWRLRAFSERIPEEVLAQVNPGDPGPTLGDDQWLERKGVNVIFDLNPAIERTLVQTGMREQVAHSLAYHGHTPDKWQRHYFNQQSDYRWRNEGGQLVFDDLVHLFQAAGFSRVLLLVDDVEKIVVPQNRKERVAFVDDLRRFFVDGPFQSVYARFYGLLLTIHPQIQQLWTPYWKAAGLDRVCPISGGAVQEYTIDFHPLEAKEAAVPLVMTYLDYFRISDDQKGQLYPFDRESVVEALRLSGGVPGPMLPLLRLAMDRAVREDWETISADQVRAIYESTIPIEPSDEEEWDPLPPTQVDLSE